MQKHVIVTGASGYVGRHVVAALLDRGVRVTALVRRFRAYRIDERAKTIEVDVLAPEFDVAEYGPADAFVHLAWEAGFNHNSPVHMSRLSSHYELLYRAAQSGIPRIVALGTMHEVGYHEGAIDATTPTSPLSLYGIAKDALRRALQVGVAPIAEVTWLRAFYILGDDRENQSIFAKLLHAADKGETEFPFTSGRNQYDFIDVAELGVQIATATLHEQAIGVINVGSGTPRSLADMVESFIAEHGLNVTLQYGAFPDRPYDSPAVWGDTTIIRSLLQDR